MTQEEEDPPSNPDNVEKPLSNGGESTEVQDSSSKFRASQAAFEALETDETLEELGKKLGEEAKARAPEEFRKLTEWACRKSRGDPDRPAKLLV